jgi:hypothetical protein
MYSKGISWIDDCRIPHNEDCKEMKKQDVINSLYGQVGRHVDVLELKPEGRFPANILVSDDMLNDGTNNKSSIRKTTGKKKDNILKNIGDTAGGFNDKGTNSRYYNIDKWFENLIK